MNIFIEIDSNTYKKEVGDGGGCYMNQRVMERYVGAEGVLRETEDGVWGGKWQ